MKRRPGALGGQQGGSPEVTSLRQRRQAQKDAQSTGDRLGAGLTTDKQGRMSVQRLPLLDPTNPNFPRLLVQALQAAGLMER